MSNRRDENSEEWTNEIPDFVEMFSSFKRRTINIVVYSGISTTVVAVLATVIYYHWEKWCCKNGSDELARTGSYFGGILGPIFGLLSFAILGATLIVQIIENTKSARFNAIQQFEETLFRLIEIHRDNQQSIGYYSKKSQSKVYGRDVLLIYTKWLGKSYYPKTTSTISFVERIKSAYDEFYGGRNKNVEVGHYFRNLYHIFKLISTSNILTNEEKERYAKLVRAQLSIPDLVLLFYNGISDLGGNFSKYIIEFSLLQDLQPSQLHISGLTMDHLYSVYPQKAFHDDFPNQS